jgi:hypothetical protein
MSCRDSRISKPASPIVSRPSVGYEEAVIVSRITPQPSLSLAPSEPQMLKVRYVKPNRSMLR